MHLCMYVSFCFSTCDNNYNVSESDLTVFCVLQCEDDVGGGVSLCRSSKLLF